MRQIAKQTRQPDEIVVVANTTEELQRPLNGLIYYQPPEPWVSLGYLRQKALDLASGDVVIWFDDDDWYHEKRIERSLVNIENRTAGAACFPLTHIFFAKRRDLRYITLPGVDITSLAVHIKAARSTRFPHLLATEERMWSHPILDQLEELGRVDYITDYLVSVGGVIIVHGDNVWNYQESRSIPDKLRWWLIPDLQDLEEWCP